MTQQEFTEAALKLTPADIDYIKSNTSLAEPPTNKAGKKPAPKEEEGNSLATDNTEDTEKDSNRKRRRVHHVWPEVGTILTVDYFGTTYEAEIIPARKKLKSGKQVELTTGPAAGTVCDSLSEAMLKATEEQRTLQNLGRKQAANGWEFWTWPGKKTA